ncbi:shikimate kinase [Arsenicicoccus dermatophilus]|uniref:shikimate kinase n=1 Tax=Arsenicicoccus dermatophilus TaxID=1076331 RepID=UPI00391703AB
MLVLVGFMGAGKSTVGALIAERTGLPLVDSDEVLTRRLGCDIPAYFREQGEAAFREAERDTVVGLLRGPDCVLALGGGALGSPEVRAALAGHDVVHLDVTLDEALGRAGDPTVRPMLARDDLPQLHARRRPVYAEVADLDVPTAGRTAVEVAEAVLAAGLPRATQAGRPAVVLVGPPGAGKADVGALLADRLGIACVQTDLEVERLAGAPAGEVFVDAGEERFRELERTATIAALRAPGVVVVGGGAITDPAVREALRDQVVVFLDVGIAEAARRIGFDASPAMVTLLPRRAWIRHMETRRPLYADAATWTVDTAGRSAQDIADQVLELLQGGSA